MSEAERYAEFLVRKLAAVGASGFEPKRMAGKLFPFQRDLVTWALRRGRSAIFASTGLGKTRMQVEWARQVCTHTNGSVLILAPLAVAAQTVAEAQSVGVRVTLCREGADVRPGINITNYERMHKFDAREFSGVVLDESSCIKHHTSKTLALMIEAFGSTPYKLCATATPAPNDYTELGTHAEFLGVCTQQEMLAEFFCHDGGETQVWRLKGHARGLFWRWVASWGAMVRTPADLGYAEGNYHLPPLSVEQHIIQVENHKIFATGDLFGGGSKSLMERRQARKASLTDRATACAKLIMECTCRPQSQKRNDWSTCRTSSAESETIQNIEPSTRRTENGQRNLSTERRPSENTVAPPMSTDSPCFERSGRATRGIESVNTASACGAFTDSATANMTPCSPARAADAQSAEAMPPTINTTDSALITAIPLVASEGSCVGSVISESADSGTTRISQRGPPCTCGRSERWVVWVDLNAEQDALEDAFGDECFSVYGSLDIDEKEDRLNRFISGERRILLGKPSIFGFGLNLQMCARMAFVGLTDSWEAYFQAIRRCWRFGQTRPVEVHVYASELEGEVVKNLERKAADAEKMSEELSIETADAVKAQMHGVARLRTVANHTQPTTLPEWLRTRGA
jgi:hypothetical protein